MEIDPETTKGPPLLAVLSGFVTPSRETFQCIRFYDGVPNWFPRQLIFEYTAIEVCVNVSVIRIVIFL